MKIRNIIVHLFLLKSLFNNIIYSLNLKKQESNLFINQVFRDTPIQEDCNFLQPKQIIYQQPILLNGGSLPALNVFHEPIWINNNDVEMPKPELNRKIINNNYQNELIPIDKHVKINQRIEIGDNELNNPTKINDSFDQIQQEMTNNNINIDVKTNYQEDINRVSNEKIHDINERRIEGINIDKDEKIHDINERRNEDNNLDKGEKIFDIKGRRFKEIDLNISDKNQENSPLCIRREGMLKIRDLDQKDKDVVVTYAVLTKNRLSYFVNDKDETSIQGSIDLSDISESLKIINGFPSCFYIKTFSKISDCSICAESDDSAKEWINAITQNSINCSKIFATSTSNRWNSL